MAKQQSGLDEIRDTAKRSAGPADWTKGVKNGLNWGGGLTRVWLVLFLACEAVVLTFAGATLLSWYTENRFAQFTPDYVPLSQRLRPHLIWMFVLPAVFGGMWLAVRWVARGFHKS